jgi:anti-repressor protein
MEMINTFNFKGAEIRTFKDENGDPWFLAKEVCEVLEIVNVSQACARLDQDERMALDTSIYSTYTGSHGGSAPIIVSEPGFYNLVGSSKSPKAQEFKRWIRHEVLPSIRKTGAYVKPLTQDEYTMELANRVIGLIGDKRELQAQLEEAKPDVAFAQAIKASDHLRAVEDVANNIGKGCGKTRLFAFMREIGWVYYGGDGVNTPYATAVNAGWLKTVETPWDKHHRDGRITKEVSKKTMVTGLGEQRLIALWIKHGLPIRKDLLPKK